jgi:deazaflavin-dependent oxidoreductase (nitroreductase family)
MDLPALLAPVNALLTPAIQAGLGSPLPLLWGLVVLEVRGRRSGRTRAVPLVCTDQGATLIVATVRRDSQWIRNLEAEPDAAVWLRGRRREVTARVFHPDTEPPSGQGPEALVLALWRTAGASVALLDLHDG